ncbi:MAG: hypothetical protein ACOZBL_04110 [Patescibacteria group bacterium]
MASNLSNNCAAVNFWDFASCACLDVSLIFFQFSRACWIQCSFNNGHIQGSSRAFVSIFLIAVFSNIFQIDLPSVIRLNNFFIKGADFSNVRALCHNFQTVVTDQARPSRANHLSSAPSSFPSNLYFHTKSCKSCPVDV